MWSSLACERTLSVGFFLDVKKIFGSRSVFEFKTCCPLRHTRLLSDSDVAYFLCGPLGAGLLLPVHVLVANSDTGKLDIIWILHGGGHVGLSIVVILNPRSWWMLQMFGYVCGTRSTFSTSIHPVPRCARNFEQSWQWATWVDSFTLDPDLTCPTSNPTPSPTHGDRSFDFSQTTIHFGLKLGGTIKNDLFFQLLVVLLQKRQYLLTFWRDSSFLQSDQMSPNPTLKYRQYDFVSFLSEERAEFQNKDTSRKPHMYCKCSISASVLNVGIMPENDENKTPFSDVQQPLLLAYSSSVRWRTWVFFLGVTHIFTLNPAKTNSKLIS